MDWFGIWMRRRVTYFFVWISETRHSDNLALDNYSGRQIPQKPYTLRLSLQNHAFSLIIFSKNF